MRIDEIEVWITCEEQRLPEYDTQPLKGDNEKTKTFACFIPSEAGKNFNIEWQNTSAGDVLGITVKLDGTSAGTTWCNPQETGCVAAIRVSPTTKKPLQFCQLETTDADDALHVPANADLGAIRVQVSRVKLELIENPKPRTFAHKFGSVGPVHERSKKLGAHCVTLGEAIEAPSLGVSKWKSTPIDPKEGPMAELIFHYRPQVLLQAQDIAPPTLRSPPPSHGPPARQDSQEDDVPPAKRPRLGTAGLDSVIDLKPDISNLSDHDDDEDELGMLKGQLSQIMDRIAQMEQKKKRRKDGVSLKVKKEEVIASSSRLGASSGDVIDLTLSD